MSCCVFGNCEIVARIFAPMMADNRGKSNGPVSCHRNSGTPGWRRQIVLYLFLYRSAMRDIVLRFQIPRLSASADTLSGKISDIGASSNSPAT